MGSLKSGTVNLATETARILVMAALAFVVLNVMATYAFATRGVSLVIGFFVLIAILKRM